MDFTLQDLTSAGLPAVSTDGNAQNAQTQFSRELTSAEWRIYLSISDPKLYKALQAQTDALTIPNWATWSRSQLQTWWNNNLSNAAVDALSIPAGAKTMMKAQNEAILRLSQMVLALRDHTGLIE